MNRPFSRHTPPQPQYRVNGRIRAREVRVIGVDGQQAGIFDLATAIKMAIQHGVDLGGVERAGRDLIPQRDRRDDRVGDAGRAERVPRPALRGAHRGRRAEKPRDLDDAITALSADGPRDQLQLARLKKRKLLLRDEIAVIEDQLIPDIIA